MPIRRLLTIFHAFAIIVCMGLTVAVLVFVLLEAVPSTVEQTARAAALDTVNTLTTTGALSAADRQRIGQGHATVIVRDTQGKVLVAVGQGLAGDAGARYWQQPLVTGDITTGHVDHIGDLNDVYVYAVPLKRAGQTVGVVEAAMSYHWVGSHDYRWVMYASVGAVIALVLVIATSYLLARKALAPVDAIARAAREITESDLSRRLPVKRPKDELGQLAITFNELLGRLEAAFHQREEALAQQQRFVADASHELRTPLTSILGYARMLRQWGLDDPAKARESVIAIERQAKRMSGLTEGLLSLAKGDIGAPLVLTEIDLGGVVAEAVAAARVVANGKVTLSLEVAGTPLLVCGDRDQILQVTRILLDNAVKYTPAGGRAMVSLRSEDETIALAVNDTGIGIAPEHLPHIFERFYRADVARTEGGSGLGLAIAGQIIERHGGTIAVQSRPGRGSVFTLWLPKIGQIPVVHPGNDVGEDLVSSRSLVRATSRPDRTSVPTPSNS